MERSYIRSLVELPLTEVLSIADKIRRENVRPKIDLCSIINAKSGMCAEDCKFCAQSARHATGAAVYPLKDKRELIEAARRAKAIGAGRFDIVTSGNKLTKDDIRMIADAVSEIRSEVGIAMCASLGQVDEEGLLLLKNSGVSRYHHNIETSPRYFSKIVTTHSFEDRVETIRAAKKAGMEVCSGGIIGMGETWDDRVDMAIILKELGVDSVPINMLVPVKGTPFGEKDAISPLDAIRTIAIFRIVLKDKIIKIAAGRESVLKDFQAMAFMAGANGMLIGGYLTIKGRDVEDDLRLVREVEGEWNRKRF